jgi:hypothetical protein
MRKKYTKELLEPIVKCSTTISAVIRKLGMKVTGGVHANIKKIIKRHGIDTSHFVGQSFHCGQASYQNKKHWSEVLKISTKDSRESSKLLRRALLESGRKYECEVCGNTGEWMGKPITLEIDHKNDNWLDNRQSNIWFLCPNCHSQKAIKYVKSIATNTADHPKQKRSRGNRGCRHTYRCKKCNDEFKTQRPKQQYCSQRCFKIASRKVERPTRDELINLLKTASWCEIGRKYGVSDSAIRKWVKFAEVA